MGSMALSDEERIRLTRLLGMLGSAFDGERASAAAMADKLVRSKGMTWADVLSSRPAASSKPYTPPPPPKHSVAGKIDFLFGARIHLTDWEVKFLSDIRDRAMLSIRQEAVLDKILQRAGWQADD